MLWRIQKQPTQVVNKVLSSIPRSVLLDCTKTIADLAMGDGSYLAEVARLRVENGSTPEEAQKTLYGFESSPVYLAAASRLNGLHDAKLAILKPDRDLDSFEMKFDVIVGNPPYNNKGKMKGQKQTSGTSLWLQFLKVTPNLLNPGGWCSLLVPSAVGNTNSLGWKALKDCRVVDLETGVGEKYFKVGTGISKVTFTKDSPSDVHILNGVEVNRSTLAVLPAECTPVALSVFKKLTSFEPMSGWRRDGWTDFSEKAKGKTVVGMSFLDRSTSYKLQTFEELEARDLKKVNMCWMETQDVDSLTKLMGSKLFSFYASQTMFSGNLQVGMVRALSVPKNWESLTDDESVYNAYGLTEEEVKLVESCSSM